MSQKIDLTTLRALAVKALDHAAPLWVQARYEDGDSEVGGYGTESLDTIVQGCDPDAPADDDIWDGFDAGNVHLAAYLTAAHPKTMLALIDALIQTQAPTGAGAAGEGAGKS